jgi:hypothetical protein
MHSIMILSCLFVNCTLLHTYLSNKFAGKVDDDIVRNDIDDFFFAESMRVVKGETATRTSFQRSAKGNVSIQECQPEGKFVVLENTHRSKEEPISEWKLKRKIDGKREVVYTLPKDFVLKPGKSVKVR